MIIFHWQQQQPQQAIQLDMAPVTLRKEHKIKNIWVLIEDAIVGKEVKVEGEIWKVERLGSTYLPVSCKKI